MRACSSFLPALAAGIIVNPDPAVAVCILAVFLIYALELAWLTILGAQLAIGNHLLDGFAFLERILE